jgi:hypothetical protein
MPTLHGELAKRDPRFPTVVTGLRPGARDVYGTPVAGQHAVNRKIGAKLRFAMVEVIDSGVRGPFVILPSGLVGGECAVVRVGQVRCPAMWTPRARAVQSSFAVDPGDRERGAM